MKSKLISCAVLMTVLAAGCQQADDLDGRIEKKAPIFTAEIETSLTKTSVDTDRNVLWSADDLLSIFAASTDNTCYRVASGAGTTNVTLEAVPNGSFTAGTAIANNIAWYPYDRTVSYSNSGGNHTLRVVLPAIQNYAESSFGTGANPMVAITPDAESRSLAFKNVGGVLKLSLTGDKTVSKIVLMGNNGELLSGAATVTVNVDGTPTIEMEATASPNVTLSCETGTTLSETATTFWIVTPPTVFRQGFKVRIYDTENGFMEQALTSECIMERAMVQPMAELAYAANGSVETVSAIDEVADKLAAAIETAESAEVTVTDEVSGTGNAIDIPAAMTAENTPSVTFNFANVASDAAITIGDADATTPYAGDININVPVEVTASQITIAAPNAHVTVNGGTWDAFVASTSGTTLVIGADCYVRTLTVNAGNVRLLGKVDDIVNNTGATLTVEIADNAVWTNRDANMNADATIEVIEVVHIATAADLAVFAASVNDGTSTATKAVLTANIDMTGMPLAPIVPVKNQGFNGSPLVEFDGNDKTISNLTIDTTPTLDYYALFATFKGYLHDLTLDGVTVDVPTSASGQGRGAALVGRFDAGSVENCTVGNATVKSSQKAGILIGFVTANNGNTAIVKGCTVRNSTIEANESVVWQAGGLIGYAQVISGNLTVENNTADNISILNGYTSDDFYDMSQSYSHAFVGNVVNVSKVATDFNNCTVEFKNNAVTNCSNALKTYARTTDYCGDYLIDGSSSGYPYATKFIIDGVVMNGSTEPALVSIPSELMFFSGKNVDKDITLVADIDLGGKDFAGIASRNITFDGQGHTVSNYNLVRSGANGEANWIGFFTYRPGGCGVTVKNVTFDTFTTDDAFYAGGVVAYAEGDCSLTDVTVKNATVKAANKVGALVGFNTAYGSMTITNCHVAGSTVSTDVTGVFEEWGGSQTPASGEGQAGGLMGYAQAPTTTITGSTVKNTTIKSHMTGDSKTFGEFIGTFHGGKDEESKKDRTLTITGCSVDGNTLVGLDETAQAYTSPYGKLLGGWRVEGGTVMIDGTDMARIDPAKRVRMNGEGYATILAALTAAIENNLEIADISLPEGIYEEYNTVNINGKGIDVAISAAPGAARDNVILLGGITMLRDYDVTIKNITIKLNNVGSYNHGIYFGSKGALTVENVYFDQDNTMDNSGIVMLLGAGADVSIRNCVFDSCGGRPLQLDGRLSSDDSAPRNVVVYGCTFYNPYRYVCQFKYGYISFTLRGCTIDNTNKAEYTRAAGKPNYILQLTGSASKLCDNNTFTFGDGTTDDNTYVGTVNGYCVKETGCCGENNTLLPATMSFTIE